MNVMTLDFSKWYLLDISINWLLALVIVVSVVGIVNLIEFLLTKVHKRQIDVDEIVLGIGDSCVKLKYNRKEQEIAYKLWVELSTRKIGLEFEPEKDVVEEVYNSWYVFFGIARNLLKEIPCQTIDKDTSLVSLTSDVLNIGLRPHLTMWHAKFSKWYKIESEKRKDDSPQDIQKDYPFYDELVRDLIETNKRMVEYRKIMGEIAFKK